MSCDFVLKWGIVSSGLISQDFCTALLSLKSDYHKLVGVAAQQLDNARQFAQRFNIPNYYDSYDKLNENPDINVLYIGSINTTHKDICLKAINAGKHILCEKPMTLNSAEQEEVLNAAKSKGVFFMEALWTRFFPTIQRLKSELAQGTIGEVKYFNSCFMVPIKDVARIKNKSLGGGAIIDIGIYPIQLACLVFGHEKPTKIIASGHLMESGVDECCSITLLFPGQKIGVINISSNCAMFGSTYIVGEKGALQIPEYSWCPTKLVLPNGEIAEQSLPECEKTNYHNSVGLRFQAEAIREYIARGELEHPLATHDNSRLIMSIMDEARKQLGAETY